MSRIRSIHPGIWTDEQFVGLSSFARLLFIGLWNECDDKGTFQWSPLQMKMRILPADNVDAAALLEELLTSDSIARYEIGGKRYGAVRNFCKFQRPKKPNDIHPISAEMLAFVGFNAERTPDEPDDVPNQLPTGGEKAAQMEDGEEEEGEVSEANASSSPAKSDLNDRVLSAWNEGPAKRGAKRAIKIDAALGKHLNARVRDHGETAVFDAIRGIQASDHHCGRTDKNWRAGLVWILESPGNFMKALEMAPLTSIPAASDTERIKALEGKISLYERNGRESELPPIRRELASLKAKSEGIAA